MILLIDSLTQFQKGWNEERLKHHCISLTINRQAQKILENREKLEKEIKSMEDIATSLTDVIAISAPTEVEEDPRKTVSMIKENFESYKKKFELFNSR